MVGERGQGLLLCFVLPTLRFVARGGCGMLRIEGTSVIGSLQLMRVIPLYAP